MKCGIASVNITPQKPVELGGFRWNRGENSPFSSVEDPLYASCFYFEGGDSKSLLILLDLIWVSERFCDEIKTKLEEELGLKPQQVLIAASHTHSSPQLLRRTDYYGQHDARYEETLSKKVMQCTQAALANTETCSLRFGVIPFGEPLGINRISFGKHLITRKPSALQSPNPERPVDNEIRCLAVYDETDQLRGLLYNTSLHPVFNKENVVSADFPGEIRTQLQAKLGKQVTVGFLQGFAGDVRPNIPSPKKSEIVKNLLKHGKPKPRFKKNIKAHKSPLSKKISGMIWRGLNTLDPLNDSPSAHITRRIAFPLYEENDKAGLRVQLQRMDLPGGLSFVSINGELFSAYLDIIWELQEKTGRKILPVGYANGMLGYLPDRSILRLQAGYEYDSWEKFGLPEPVPSDFPDRLKLNLYKLFE